MKFRIKTASIHFAISLMVALCSLMLIFMIWHPNPLQKAVGVTHIVLLILTIDVILGPLLTFLVASSPTKKTLKFDLMVIAVLQLSAFFYGMYTVTVSRPVYLAFDALRFELVQADTVIRDKDTPAQYSQNPVFAPQWVSIKPYDTPDEQYRRMQLEMSEAISPSMQASLYQSIDAVRHVIISKTQSLDELYNYNSTDEVKQVLAKYHHVTGFIPLKATATDMTVLVDKEGHVVEIVDLRPWE